MNSIIKAVFQAQEECTSVLKELDRVLLAERSSLVRLVIDEISENTRLKESLNQQLIQKSKILKKLVEAHFETLNDFEEKMSEDELNHWKKLREEFWMHRENIRKICEVNQGFLKSSLRNLSTLSDHLRRLFGEQPLYTQKGTKIDRTSHGRVLETSY